MAQQRFTVYDVLEAKGYFSKNPANASARGETGEALYVGPQAYPRMLYHPKGEEWVVVPGELVQKANQWVLVGERKEIINRVVHNKEEEDAAVAEGWHRHPAAALAAAGKEAPSTGASQTIEDLEAKIKELMAEKEALAKLIPKAPLGKSI